MHSICLVPLLASLGIPQSLKVHPLDRELSFESACATVPQVLKALSDSSSVRLIANAKFKDEVLILCAKRQSLRNLMPRVAEALSAQWVQEQEQFRLIRSDGQIRKLKQEHIERLTSEYRLAQHSLRESLKNAKPAKERANYIARTIEAISTHFKESGADSVNWPLVSSLNQVLPASRLAEQVATLLDPVVLAQNSGNGTIFFSTSATKLQHPLPTSALEFTREYFETTATIRSQLPSSASLLQAGNHLNIRALLAEPEVTPIPDKVIAEVVLIPRKALAMVTVYVANRERRIIAEGRTHIRPPPKLTTSRELPEVEGWKQPVELSPLSQAWADNTKNLFVTGIPPDPIPEIVALLIEPSKRDASELSLYDFLKAVSKTIKLNVVCSPTQDFPFEFNMPVSRPAPQLRDTLQSLDEPWSTMAWSIEDGWLTLKPQDPYNHITTCLSRSLLRSLIESAVKSGFSTIEQASLLAGSMDGCIADSALSQYLVHTAPRSVNPNISQYPELFKMMGQLRIGKTSGSSKSGSIQFSNIPKAIQAEITQSLLSSNWEISLVDQTKGSLVVEPEASLDSFLSERLPYGIPSATEIAWHSFTEETIRMERLRQKPYRFRELSISQFASFMKSTGEVIPQNEFDSFSTRERSYVQFRISPGDKYLYTASVRESRPTSNSVSNPASLPSRTWQSIRELVRNQSALYPRRIQAIFRHE